MLMSLLVALTTPGLNPGGCAPNGPDPFARDPGPFFAPDPYSLMTRPYVFAWTTPYGGYTLYPGQAGSGYGTHSDYSHINWLTTPEQNAGMVRGRLAQMGIPAVPHEPIFLGRNPSVTDDIKLPPPRPKPPKDPPAEKEPDK